MGNQISYGSPGTGKVILLDGSIQEFDTPLTVAELMLEYPQQMVVDLKSSAEQRATPLPADKILEIDKIYLMVPVRKGKPSHLSPQEAHHILLRVNAMLRSKSMLPYPLPSSMKFLPLIAKICPTTTSSKIEDNYYSKPTISAEILGAESDEVDEEDLDVFEKPDYYLSRQISGKGWKPSLDTIVEKKNEVKKPSNWVIVAKTVGKRIQTKGLVWG